MIKAILTVLLLFNYCFLSAQELQKNIHYEDKPVAFVLEDIKEKFNVNFSYSSDLVENKRITLDKYKRSLQDVLFEISQLIAVDFIFLNKNYIYLKKSKTQAIQEVIVHSFQNKGVNKNNNGSFSLNTNKMELLTGLTESDILEGLQQLPGVMSINDTATGLNVRGGTVDQNLIIFDGINIYHPGHLFGMISVFNPNIADNIVFINKGTNPAYGERVASTVIVNTTNKIPTKKTVEFGINGLSIDGYLNTVLVKDKLGIQLSFRRSYEDIVETKTFKKHEEQAFQHAIIADEQFNFKDYNLKLNYIINNKNTLSISAIHVDNDLENNTVEELSNNTHIDFIDTENDGYSLKWNSKWNNKLALETSLNYAHFRLDYNSKLYTNNYLINDYYKKNSISDYGFKTALKITNKHQTHVIGYQNSVKKVSFTIKDFDNNIYYNLDNDNRIITSHSLFNNNVFQKNNWTINYGLRANYFSQLETYSIEPRFTINKKLNDRLNIQITGEHKSQIIKQIDETVLSDLSSTIKVWRLSDGIDHPIIKSKQITAGFTYSYNKWLFDTDVYYKKTTGVSALSLGFLNPLDNSIHIGTQKTIGLDVFAQRKFTNFTTWITYSLMDSKNNYKGLNNGKSFTANTAVKHLFTGAINYKKNKLQTGLGWTIRSGKPLTDLDYNLAGNAYFDGINTETLPLYYRFDFSTTYHFNLSNNMKIKIGLAVKNILNTKNHIATIFTGNNTATNPITPINRYSSGLTPNFLVRVYW